MSPAVALLNHVWRHSQKATGHSWLKLNHALADTLSLAIKSGMKFELDDFETIAKEFNSGYWIGADPEWIYRTAVLYRNSSAYLAWEQNRGRKPFIWPASITVHTGDGPAGNGLARLIIGADFKWSGESVKVTSFNDKAQSLTTCSFTHTQEAPCPRCVHCYSSLCGASLSTKIHHRYTITHADLKAAKKKATTPGEREAAEAALCRLHEGSGQREEIKAR